MGIVFWYFISAIIAIPFLFLFYFLYGVYRDTRPGRMRAVFIDSNKSITAKMVTLQDNGKSFRIKNQRAKYQVVAAAVARSGMFRIPTSYYIQGNTEPLNLLTMKAEVSLLATDFEEATETHVAADIIDKFSDPILTPLTGLIIVIIVVIIAVGASWNDISGDVTEIQDALGLNQEQVIRNE